MTVTVPPVPPPRDTEDTPVEVLRAGLKVPLLVAAGVETVLAPHRSRVAVVPDGGPVHVEIFDPVTHGTAVQSARMERVPLVALVHPRTREAEARARGLGAHRVLDLDVPAVELVRSLEEVCRPPADRTVVQDDAAERSADPALARLSPRELEVLAHIGRGHSNEEIAQELYLSINSVKTYVRLAYRKIGVNTRPRAVIWAREHDLTPGG